MLPAYTSLLTGQLPFDHGVRDEAGFALKTDTRTLAELLRSRGFTTGAAVSSFLLRKATGLSRGFAFYGGELGVDARRPRRSSSGPAADTFETAAQWLRSQSGQRFMLFVEVPANGADAVVRRSASTLLKERGLYDKATVIVVGGRGAGAASGRLDDATLRDPAAREAAGWRGRRPPRARAGAAHRPAADGARSGARPDARASARTLAAAGARRQRRNGADPADLFRVARGPLPLRRPPGLRAHQRRRAAAARRNRHAGHRCARHRSAEPDAGRARTPPRSAPSSIGCSTGTIIGAGRRALHARRRALRAARRPDGAGDLPDDRTDRAAAGSDRA